MITLSLKLKMRLASYLLREISRESSKLVTVRPIEAIQLGAVPDARTWIRLVPPGDYTTGKACGRDYMFIELPRHSTAHHRFIDRDAAALFWRVQTYWQDVVVCATTGE